MNSQRGKGMDPGFPPESIMRRKGLPEGSLLLVMEERAVLFWPKWSFPQYLGLLVNLGGICRMQICPSGPDLGKG